MDNDVLRQAPLFSALDDEAASALRASMSENRLRRGDVLFHEGDSGDKLYIVLDGKVKLGRTSSDGRENLLAILGPGQMFGELSLFDPGPRSATVTAVTDVSPRRCSNSPTASAAPPTTASTSTTTSPRRSSPSWSAPPARPSTRRWPTSPRGAGCAWSPARSSSWTSSGSPDAPADAPLTSSPRGSDRSPGIFSSSGAPTPWPRCV